MRNSLRDENDKAVASGVSSADSTTPVMLRVDPITDYLLVDNASDSITVVPKQWNKRDENDVPTVYGVSSIDGVTLIPIRTDNNGRLLIQY